MESPLPGPTRRTRSRGSGKPSTRYLLRARARARRARVRARAGATQPGVRRARPGHQRRRTRRGRSPGERRCLCTRRAGDPSARPAKRPRLPASSRSSESRLESSLARSLRCADDSAGGGRARRKRWMKKRGLNRPVRTRPVETGQRSRRVDCGDQRDSEQTGRRPASLVSVRLLLGAAQALDAVAAPR